MEKKDSKPKQLFFQKPAVIFFLICIVAAVIGGVSYYLTQTNGPKSLTSEEEVKQTVATVGKLMQLPTDETPTVASVSDITKLTNQPFFSQAQNGDKVLIYNNKKQAILYRPSTNLIIEVAPITVTTATPGPTNQPAISTTPNPSIKVAKPTFVLYNGTQATGLTKQYEKELLSKFPEADIINRGNAKESYATTILVDLGGQKTAEASQIAKSLGLELKKLPEGETAPKADYLIIVGEDKVRPTTPTPTQ